MQHGFGLIIGVMSQDHPLGCLFPDNLGIQTESKLAKTGGWIGRKWVVQRLDVGSIAKGIRKVQPISQFLDKASILIAFRPPKLVIEVNNVQLQICPLT